jgi:hypothetical protein
MPRIRVLKPLCILLPLAIVLAGCVVLSPELAEDAQALGRRATHRASAHARDWGGRIWKFWR